MKKISLAGEDCRPFQPQPNADQVQWLRKLVARLDTGDLVVQISEHREDDEPIVFCERDGTWWCGRYVGSIKFDGGTLTINPRFGLAALRNWLTEATSVVLTPASGKLRSDTSFIAEWLAAVWVHGFVDAARHGLPRLRREVVSQSTTLRGRLDVGASVRLIATGSREVVSVRSERLLDHVVSDVLVAAYERLRRLTVDERWMVKRASELMPQLRSVTGVRPRVPTKAELDRVRYTPITEGFRHIANLSLEIAHRRGLTLDADADGEAQGVLLDVAELWEMYVVSVLRKAAAPMVVKHGTRVIDALQKLLRSEATGQGMGTLKPDAVVYREDVVLGVADAKYKSLFPTASAVHGPQREDMYQMAAYMSRYVRGNGSDGWGMVIYPFDAKRPEITPAELQSPWSLGDGKKLIFTTLPHDAGGGTAKLRRLIEMIAST